MTSVKATGQLVYFCEFYDKWNWNIMKLKTFIKVTFHMTDEKWHWPCNVFLWLLVDRDVYICFKGIHQNIFRPRLTSRPMSPRRDILPMDLRQFFHKSPSLTDTKVTVILVFTFRIFNDVLPQTVTAIREGSLIKRRFSFGHCRKLPPSPKLGQFGFLLQNAKNIH